MDVYEEILFLSMSYREAQTLAYSWESDIPDQETCYEAGLNRQKYLQAEADRSKENPGTNDASHLYYLPGDQHPRTGRLYGESLHGEQFIFLEKESSTLRKVASGHNGQFTTFLDFDENKLGWTSFFYPDRFYYGHLSPSGLSPEGYGVLYKPSARRIGIFVDSHLEQVHYLKTSASRWLYQWVSRENRFSR